MTKEEFVKMIEEGDIDDTSEFFENVYDSIAKTVRLQDLQAIKEIVDGMIINKPDEVAELNKGLPNPLAEYAYHNAVGYCKAVEDIKVKLDELMNK